MGERRAGQRIGVIADVGLPEQVADGVVGERLHRRGILAHRRRGDAVEVVVPAPVKTGVKLSLRFVLAPAGQHVAEDVIGVGEVLGDVADASKDRVERSSWLRACDCRGLSRFGHFGMAGDGAWRIRRRGRRRDVAFSY